MTKPIGFLPNAAQGGVKPMFRSLAIAASGLSAQRQRMEVIATNLANAETTRTAEGGAYRRQAVRMAEGMAVPGQPNPAPPALLPLPDGPNALFAVPFQPVGEQPGAAPGAAGVRVDAVEQDATDGPLVYDPGHPDADAAGYVRYPNVRVTDELVDLLDARRVYDANATVFQAAKQMLRKALDI